MAFQQYQLSDARADLGIKAVVGACSNTADFLNLINTVTRRLMKRGNFYETELRVKLCVYGCRITWPAFVGTVLGTRFCGKNDQTPIDNKWYSVIGSHDCNSMWNSNAVLVDGNTSPTFREISGNTGKLIRYYCVKATDLGKKITIYGTKYGGMPLQQKVNGVWEMGLDITLASPFGTTTELVTRIDSVVRESTQGMTYLYEYDSTEDQLRDLATYNPNDTNPRFRTSTIQNHCSIPFCEDSNGVKTARVEALVKVEYKPLVNDWDFLQLDDFDSLALGIQAIKLEQANASQEAELKWRAAIAELNYADRNKNPDLSTVITCNVFGSGSPTLVNPI